MQYSIIDMINFDFVKVTMAALHRKEDTEYEQKKNRNELKKVDWGSGRMGERAAKEEERNDGTTQEINGRGKRDRKEKIGWA